MNGDIILKANDKTYPPEQIDMLRKVLAETPKGALNLTIQRNAQQLEISLWQGYFAPHLLSILVDCIGYRYHLRMKTAG